MKKFIRTCDEETMKTLKELGFPLLEYDSNFWTFLNDRNLTFSVDDQKKISYSDMMYI